MANSINLEMQCVTREAAEPWFPGDSVKVAINRAAKRLGINYRRARSFWYGVEVPVRADEADHLRRVRASMAEEKIRRLEAELETLRVIANAKIEGVNRPATDELAHSAGGMARGRRAEMASYMARQDGGESRSEGA